MHALRERVLYRYGLKHVDSVIVQTRRQQKKLREGFGIDSTVVTMFSNLNDNEFVCLETDREESPRVLWVGRISKEKRFEWFLDVAEQCPKISFEVAGSPNTYSAYAQALMKRAAELSNVKMHGRVQHAEMKKIYCRSKVLCCTSEYEGFPNTFLEAWSFAIPVVSTFDPDGVIATNGLGFMAQDVAGIVTCLREVVRSPEIWLRVSRAAKQYYLAHHTPEMCLPGLERLLLDVVRYSS
jgi:glycosyltransferase involved in cell wall biosynthesis